MTRRHEDVTRDFQRIFARAPCKNRHRNVESDLLFFQFFNRIVYNVASVSELLGFDLLIHPFQTLLVYGKADFHFSLHTAQHLVRLYATKYLNILLLLTTTKYEKVCDRK